MPAQSASAPIQTNAHDLVDHSISLIIDLQDSSGAYPASPTFSAYRGYCWFRDGAFIADAMSAVGEFESAERFFDWCALVLQRHGKGIPSALQDKQRGREIDIASLPPTRFTLAGEIGSDSWWDFQTDGYGTWLWALSEHARRGGRIHERWLPAIRKTIEFLIATWDLPCYDWWEMHEDKTHVSTLGCVIAGLQRSLDEGWVTSELASHAQTVIDRAWDQILDQGVAKGHLTKWLGSEEVDASLLSLITMGVLDNHSEIAEATLTAVRDQLLIEGGVHRFLEDVYFGGGQWPLLTCFLGLAEVKLGQSDQATQRLAWTSATATSSGDIPEQVDHHLLDASHHQEWLDRWGPVATPLLWSHAMFVRLSVEERTS